MANSAISSHSDLSKQTYHQFQQQPSADLAYRLSSNLLHNHSYLFQAANQTTLRMRHSSRWPAHHSYLIYRENRVNGVSTSKLYFKKSSVFRILFWIYSHRTASHYQWGLLVPELQVNPHIQPTPLHSNQHLSLLHQQLLHDVRANLRGAGRTLLEISCTQITKPRILHIPFCATTCTK